MIKHAHETQHQIGLGIQAPPTPWCYGCASPVYLHCSTDAGCLTREVAVRLIRSNPERPLLRTSMTEPQVYQSCRCPHLDRSVITRFREMWMARGNSITDANCAAGTYTVPVMTLPYAVRRSTTDAPPQLAAWDKYQNKCKSRNTYVCLTCGVPLCGPFTEGHMHQHAVQHNHLLVLGTRTLNCYCFGCCRHLGLGDDLGELRLTRRLRHVVGEFSFIHHQHENVWRLFDRAVMVHQHAADLEATP